jgi:predicted  nucleic acid-binding Zn-ribbon protein
MTVEEKFDKLRDLQTILSEKIRIEREIEAIPKMFSAQNELILRLKKAFIEKNEDYEFAVQAQAELKTLLKDAETNRETAEKKMDLISTQREYEALDKEIKDATEKEHQYRKDLDQEDRKISQLDEQMKQNEAFIEQQESELNERKERTKSEMEIKKKRVAQLQAEEIKLTADMDAELLFKFDRIIRNKGGMGIVSIKNGVCNGCHMILPAQFANIVHAGEEIVFCPYCSRILYHEDATSEEEQLFDIETVGSLADIDDIDEEADADDADEEDEVLSYEE